MRIVQEEVLKPIYCNMKKIWIIPAIMLLATQAHAQVTFAEGSTDMFVDQTVRSSHPVGVTDMNNDGLDDVIRMDSGVDVFVNYQQPDGSFIEVHMGDLGMGGDDAWGMAIADFDGNGYCDIMAGGWYDQIKIGLLSDDGTSMTVTYADADAIFVQGVSLFDMNYDGHTDIFACHDDGPSQIIFNDGNGGFVYDAAEVNAVINTSLYGGGEDDAGNYGSCFTDVDNDGYFDLYIAKCRQGVTDSQDVRRINQLWLYDPETQSFYEAGAAAGIDTGAQSWSADFGDIDNDGDLDMYVGNHDTNNMLFENNGDGTFTDISVSSGVGVVVPFATIQTAMRDFDNDGYLDILATGGGSHYLALNNGDNTFTAYQDLFSFDINSFGLGDLNDDGYIDILAVQGGYGGPWGGFSSDAIVMNNGGDNNWLKVNLDGTESNPDGIGARVTIEGPFGMMVRDVKSGESYGIVNSMISHFGLGTFDSITTLTVQWPSGVVDVLTDVDVNQTVTVEEGTFVGIAEPADAVEISVFPNPATDYVQVQCGNTLKNAEFTIMDMNGRNVELRRFTGSSLKVNTTQLSSGMYTWKVVAQGKCVAEGKLVK